MNKRKQVSRLSPLIGVALVLGLWIPATTQSFAPPVAQFTAPSVRVGCCAPQVLSQVGVELIKRSETLRLHAYFPAGGTCTIGWGHTETARRGMRISADHATQLLHADLRDAQHSVRRLVKVPLSSAQFDALVSFVFNVGVAKFRKSTLLRELNARRYHQVPRELMRWTKVRVAGSPVELRGLRLRRAAEAQLFMAATSRRYTPAPLFKHGN